MGSSYLKEPAVLENHSCSSRLSVAGESRTISKPVVLEYRVPPLTATASRRSPEMHVLGAHCDLLNQDLSGQAQVSRVNLSREP